MDGINAEWGDTGPVPMLKTLTGQFRDLIRSVDADTVPGPLAMLMGQDVGNRLREWSKSCSKPIRNCDGLTTAGIVQAVYLGYALDIRDGKHTVFEHQTSHLDASVHRFDTDEIVWRNYWVKVNILVSPSGVFLLDGKSNRTPGTRVALAAFRASTQKTWKNSLMQSVFLTGGNGYLGAYVCAWILKHRPNQPLHLLVRARDERHAYEKLWATWQLHMDVNGFEQALKRVTLVYGDLHAKRLGLTDGQYQDVLERCDSILHIAARLNRKSSKACLNTNLRGTLSVIQLACAMEEKGSLRRYSHVSTAQAKRPRSR